MAEAVTLSIGIKLNQKEKSFILTFSEPQMHLLSNQLKERTAKMTDKIEYGIRLIYKDGTRDTRWYADKRQRDMRIPTHKGEQMVKSAKPIEKRVKK